MHFATLSSLLLLAIPLALALVHPFKDNGLEGRDSSSSPNLQGVTNFVDGMDGYVVAPTVPPSNQRGDTSSDELFGRDDADTTISKRLHDVAEEAISDPPNLQNSIPIVRDNTPGSVPDGAPSIKPDDIKNTVSQVVKDPTNLPNDIKEHLADTLSHDAQPSAAPPATKRSLDLLLEVLKTAAPAQGDSPNRRDGTSDPDLTGEYIQKLKNIKNIFPNN